MLHCHVQYQSSRLATKLYSNYQSIRELYATLSCAIPILTTSYQSIRGLHATLSCAVVGYTVIPNCTRAQRLSLYTIVLYIYIYTKLNDGTVQASYQSIRGLYATLSCAIPIFKAVQ
jgi:hypothetical protein